MRVCSISVDLDEVHHYLAIHGLTDAQVPAHLVYDVAVPRLLAWAQQLNVPLTLFAVGSDLARSQSRNVLARAVDAGHEIGNHSFEHRYDLTRRTEGEITRDVERANQVIEEATGYTPRGFRAPGYTTTETLYEVLGRAGFLYSSSVFPCFPYYAAKVAAVGLKRALGRKSKSIIDDPRVLSAPTAPYRVGRPYWRRGVGMLELPIQTTPGLRLPFIGTTLTLLGPRGSAWLSRSVVGVEFVNLELHGIDVLGVEDGLHALAAHQYDVRIAAERKLRSLEAAISCFRRAGYHFKTLADFAFQFDLGRHQGQKAAS
jgi:peptidoglycan-N-acetylglucosamine deacetylase